MCLHSDYLQDYGQSHNSYMNIVPPVSNTTLGNMTFILTFYMYAKTLYFFSAFSPQLFIFSCCMDNSADEQVFSLTHKKHSCKENEAEKITVAKVPKLQLYSKIVIRKQLNITIQSNLQLWLVLQLFLLLLTLNLCSW